MTLLADESVAGAIIERLRTDGHTVVAIGELSPGVADTQVLAEADRTQAVLLTEDKDFGELVYRQGASHRGVVLVRLAGLSRAVRAALVSEAFKAHGAAICRRIYRHHLKRHPHSSPTTADRRNGGVS